MGNKIGRGEKLVQSTKLTKLGAQTTPLMKKRMINAKVKIDSGEWNNFAPALREANEL